MLASHDVRFVDEVLGLGDDAAGAGGGGPEGGGGGGSGIGGGAPRPEILVVGDGAAKRWAGACARDYAERRLERLLKGGGGAALRA